VSIVIDDFTSGKYTFTAPTGHEKNSLAQQGTMRGGWRRTSILSQANPRNQPFHADIAAQGIDVGTGLLHLTVGTRSIVHLELHYGWGNGTTASPLKLDLTQFTKLRINFDCTVAGGTIVNWYYFSGDGRRTAVADHVNQASLFHGFPFDLTIPTAPSEKNQANPKDVQKMFIEFDARTGFAIESLELI
jgi:hypothetical protein